MRHFLMVLLIVLVLTSTAAARTWHVNVSGTGDAPTIQAGLDSASAGDTVLVACGTYYEYDISMKSEVCLMSETGVAECATIDAEQQGLILDCAYADSATTIEGITFTGGSGDRGGALDCEFSWLRISGCRFEANWASQAGGAILSFDSMVEIVNCEFLRNECDIFDGGAISFRGEDRFLVVSNCEFSENSAGSDGGAVSCLSPSSFNGCQFFGNYSANDGGGIRCYGACVLEECTFASNTAERKGGGLYVSGGYGRYETIENCTFAFNSAGTVGGIYCSSDNIVIERTIIAFSTQGEAIDCGGGPLPVLTCCDIYGNAGGDYVGGIVGQNGMNGNFSACPSFCFADANDFSLCDGSPCLPGNHPDGYDCGLIGAWGAGCSCGPSRVEGATWGTIKAIYR